MQSLGKKPKKMVAIVACALLLVALMLVGIFYAYRETYDSNGPGRSEVPGAISVPRDARGANVRIGILLPLTGSWRWIGPARNGARLAAKQINEAGGIVTPEGQRHLIELFTADTEAQSQVAIVGARKLYDVDGVIAIIGPTSTTIRSVIPITIEKQAVQVSPTAGTTALDTIGGGMKGEHIYRTVSSDVVMGSGMVWYAKNKLGAKKVAFFFADNESARSILGVLQDACRVAQLEVVGQGLFPIGQTSYRSELLSVSRGKPDVLFFESSPEMAAVHFKNWYELGLPGKWMGTDLVNEPFAKATTPASDGTIGVNPGPILSSRYENWLRAYEAMKGRPGPDPFAINAYDAMNIIALALQAGGDISMTAARDNIRKVANPPGEKCLDFRTGAALLKEGKEIDYDGIAGPQDFNEYGDPVSYLKVEEVTNGAIKRIDTLTQQEIGQVIKGVLQIREERKAE